MSVSEGCFDTKNAADLAKLLVHLQKVRNC